MAANPMCSMLSAIAGLNALLAKLNVSTAGSISIFSGAMPASCEILFPSIFYHVYSIP